ncbi:hypothetical protein [Nonomuraea sp. NPDC049400]|uniref:hypothetical protein n=1 Tax=Nonomuraea sp. NPDC049400 TaxID=3364352 RepID=UPI0037BA8577
MTVRYGGEQPRRDHYTVLGVEKAASAAQITSAVYDSGSGHDAPLGGRPVPVRVTHTPDPDLNVCARAVRRSAPAHLAAVIAGNARDMPFLG